MTDYPPELGDILDHLDEDTTRVELHAGQGNQDTLDGAALRRLREALGDNDVVIGMEEFPGDTSVDAWGKRGTGATIAEAADKCREALT